MFVSSADFSGAALCTVWLNDLQDLSYRGACSLLKRMLDNWTDRKLAAEV